jgi:predicted metal-binding protein
MRNREGAFSIYSKDEPLEVVGFITCGSCPGVNVEYAPAEMIKNGAQAIHLATGMVVGYPPCHRVDYFKRFIEEKYKIPVVIGTHPIPMNYFTTHSQLKTWNTGKWQELIKPVLSAPEMMKAYD